MSRGAPRSLFDAIAATHDWDTETYCTADGCQRPATHQQLVGMTANGDTIVEYVCCHHQGETTP